MNHLLPDLFSLGVLCLFLSGCVSHTVPGSSGEDALDQFLSRDGRKVLTFVGYSGAGYQDEAAMLRLAEKILARHDPKEVIVNLGVTPDGIGQVYQLAKERGFTTMGIVSTRARSYPPSDFVDHAFYIEDESWGGLLEGTSRLSPVSACMVEHSDFMIGIGGGEIARDELRAARNAGKQVEFWPADLNHARAIEEARKKGEPVPTDFSGAASKAL